MMPQSNQSLNTPTSSTQPSLPPITKSPIKFVLFILLALVLIAAAGYAGYAYEHNKANKQEAIEQTLQNSLDTKINNLNKQIQLLSSKQVTPGTSAYLTLAPATVEPKTAECSTPITVSNDADSGPIKCSNGDLNVTEWQYLYKTTNLSVMKLGYNATESQVDSAVCADTHGTTNDGATLPIEGTALSISTLYYRWTSSYAQINVPELSC